MKALKVMALGLTALCLALAALLRVYAATGQYQIGKYEVINTHTGETYIISDTDSLRFSNTLKQK